MKKTSFVLNIVSAAVILLLAVNSFVNGFNYYVIEGWQMIFSTVLVTLAAFVFWYIIHNVIHELFHAFAAVLFYGKIISIAVCGVEIRFVKGRKKISYRPLSAYAGATEFVCKRPEKAYVTLYASLIGGLVGTALTIVLIALIHRITSGFFSHYFVLMGFFPVLYMFLVNFFFGGPDSDGFMLFLGKNGYGAFTRAAMRLETDSYLFFGKPLSEARPVRMAAIFKETEKPDVYDYLRALEVGDAAAAKRIVTELYENAKNGDNGLIEGLIRPKCELAFLDLVANADSGKEAVERIKEEFIFSDDADSIRIHCAYRYSTGETEWAEKLKDSYFKLCEKIWVEGLKKSYIAIGERWLEKAV